MKIIDNFLKESRSFEKKDSVKALIFCPCDNLLIVRRQLDQGGEGQWDIPGGCIERGENQTEALKREVFEETGLKIDNISKVKTVSLKIPEKGINSSMAIYKAKTDKTDVKLKPAEWKGADGKTEHNELKWINKKIDLENLPMLDILKKVIMDHLK
jgi:8-oxo-dGTP diphosphatase